MASVDSGGDQVSLNVMPLLDIFSILILFLLMSFSSDPVSHDINSGVELPQSITLLSLDEVPTIVISKNQIYIKDNSIITLENGDFPIAEKEKSINALDRELEKIAESGKKYAKVEQSLQTLTFEIDKSKKFKIIKRVMLSAQQSEFVRFKLMVEKQNS